MSVLCKQHWTPTRGLELREKSYAPGTRLQDHSHDHATLILVLNGSFRETCAGETVMRNPGEMRMIPPDVNHENRYGRAGARCFLVEVHDDWLGESPVRRQSFRQALNYSQRVMPSMLVQRIWENFLVKDASAHLTVEGLLLETLGAVLKLEPGKRGATPPNWLEEVRERLHDDFDDLPSMASLAAEANVHPAHLHRAFRAHYHCTPGEYVLCRRIAWVRQRLLASDESISSIALRAGFSDQAHLTRRFHRETGTTPARFRRTGRR